MKNYENIFMKNYENIFMKNYENIFMKNYENVFGGSLVITLIGLIEFKSGLKKVVVKWNFLNLTT
jgi:hypothetical protein